MKRLAAMLKRKGLLFTVAGTFLVVSLVTVIVSIAQQEQKPAAATAVSAKPNDADIEAGKQVYFQKCVWCHGETGSGDGPGADRLWPRPRNFDQGTFKIRHTASGELPTDEDLFQTVTHGLPGSAMPSWEGILSETERRQVIQFVKFRLVDDRQFDDTENETFTPIDFGKQVASSEESIARGKEVFDTKGKCLECHGPEGRGDGNATQKDEWGFPIFPADLHKCWNFRGNREDPYNPRNVFREVSTGLNGTPMPSFADVLTPEQRWDVANFVISLCEKKKNGKPLDIDPLTDKPVNKFVVKSYMLEGEIPTDPADPKWQEIEPNYVGLGGQITHKPRNFVRLVDDVWVRSVYNGKEVAYLFEWDDRNKSIGTPETLEKGDQLQETPPAGDPIATKYASLIFNDSVAVQFPAKWQSLAPPEKPRFIFGDAKNAVDIWKWDSDGTVREYTGNGWDKPLSARSSEDLKAPTAVHKDGRWQVILVRAMETEDKDNDAQFEIGKYIPTVFFVWDGHNGDYGRKMSISSWYYTFLVPPVPMKVYVYPFVAAIILIGVEGWILRKVNEIKSRKK
jgi:mono/diheme cytochrome c family protein